MTPGGSPPAFALSSNLPVELQIKIWKFALTGPRTIQLHHFNNAFSFYNARPRSVLHTCRTSRDAALSVLEHAFTRNDKLAPIYVNLPHDTLHLVEAKMIVPAANSVLDIKKIKSLAVEITSWEDSYTIVIGIKKLSPCNLKDLILVVKHEDPIPEAKFTVRFAEPEAMLSIWEAWRGHIQRNLKHKVRLVEARIPQ